MIISASRRTDIPAFYTDWFMYRIQEGFFVRVNPMNLKQKKTFSLKPSDVDAIVFWTKNPRPLMEHLGSLTSMGYRYYFQYTLNDYPSLFEPCIPALDARIGCFKELCDCLEEERVIWRFDPIIYSSITPLAYLEDRFAHLAAELSGYTRRVMISFLDIYGKVEPRLRQLRDEYGVTVVDITLPEHSENLLRLAKSLVEIAAANHMEVFTCSESIDLDSIGIKHGACIDQNLLERLFGLTLDVRKDKAQRPQCLCAEAVDMGFYNTCASGCIYCYANTSPKAVQNAIRSHVPTSPTLVGEF